MVGFCQLAAQVDNTLSTHLRLIAQFPHGFDKEVLVGDLCAQFEVIPLISVFAYSPSLSKATTRWYGFAGRPRRSFQDSVVATDSVCRLAAVSLGFRLMFRSLWR